jgi:hypothetical protein
MTTRDQEEQDLRIDQMTINIEKIRQDLDQAKLDQKWETRKFVLQTFVGAVAAVAAGVGIGNLIWARREPPQPPTIILQQPAPPPAPLKPPP